MVEAAFWNASRHWPKQHPYLIRRIPVQLRQAAPQEPFVVVQDADDMLHQIIIEIGAERADTFLAELRVHPHVVTIDPIDADERGRL